MNLLGKLSWSAIPFDQPIPLGASVAMILAVVGVLGWITRKGYWPYLWREWITSVDHKRIGVMYCVLALVMLLRGFSDAIMMRSQQAFAAGGAQGYLPPEHYDQIFSAHGTIMIFFMAMPFVIGLMNFAVPLQLGVRDVAFPTLNSVSFWLTASGVLLTNLSLVIGEFANTGWMAYPPLSELRYSPGVGVDYYLWSLQISGIGTLMTGINFVTTILKMRAPGMTYMRMPVFCWTALATNLLIVAAFPVLTATFAMLLLDRYLGFHFFTVDARRQHDDVRQSVLGVGPPGSVHPHPAGVRRLLRGDRHLLGQAAVRLPLDGRRHHGDLHPLVPGLAASFLHHGRRRRRQRLLRHHVDDHRRADRRENLQLAVHDVWRAGTLSRADPVVDRLHGHLCDRRHDRRSAGGAAGRLRSAQQPVLDRALSQRHHRRRRVRRAWRATITGSPRRSASGSTNAGAPAAFWCWLVGFYLAFMPLYVLGLMGMTRRMQHYDDLALAAVADRRRTRSGGHHGGIACQIVQLFVSIRNREALRDLTGDPWNGRTLEWSTPSPPPPWNFAVLPQVTGIDAFWIMKQQASAQQAARPQQTAPARPPDYEPIEVPNNSATGFVTAFFAVVTGFALIWHIWWMVIVGIIGALATMLVFAWREQEEVEIPADEVARIDREYRTEIAA